MELISRNRRAAIVFGVCWVSLLLYRLILPEMFLSARVAFWGELYLWIGWPLMLFGLWFDNRKQ